MKTRNIFIIAILSFFVLTINAQNNNEVKYYMSKTINVPFEEATQKVKDVLKEQQFGVISEMDMDEKLAEKMPDIKMKKYRMLGACNPSYAYKTMQVEENIGLFLPCKILIKEVDENTTEVVMIDPSAVMGMLGNPELVSVADEVTVRFRNALNDL